MSLIFLRKNIFTVILFAAGFITLLVIAAQYPLSTTFPMGGDAPAYIIVTKHLFSDPTDLSVLTHNWYPLSQLIFTPMTLIPVGWPMRFILWASLGQIVSGIAFAWLIFRISNPYASAASLAFWGITPIVATRHFEDGTIAQLWSYTFLFLFIERFYSNKPWSSSILLIATFLSHPITGLALFLVVAATILPLWKNKYRFSKETQKTITILLINTLILVGVGAILFNVRASIFNAIEPATDIHRLINFFHTTLAPIVYLSIIGSIYLLHITRSSHTRIFWFTLLLAFLLLSANYYLELNVWTDRLQPLFIIILIICGSLGWSYVTQHLPNLIFRTVISLVFFSILTLGAWNNNVPVYAFYESPSRYARIHPGEVAAIEWMNQTLPNQSIIYSTAENRHTEWIPVLTNFQWNPVRVQYFRTAKRLTSEQKQDAFAIFFLHRESLPEDLRNNPNTYPVIYSSPDAVIVKLSSSTEEL